MAASFAYLYISLKLSSDSPSQSLRLWPVSPGGGFDLSRNLGKNVKEQKGTAAPDRHQCVVLPREDPMITSQECNRFSNECYSVGTDPEISIRRATAAMAVCSLLIQLAAKVAVCERIKVEEG